MAGRVLESVTAVKRRWGCRRRWVGEKPWGSVSGVEGVCGGW